MRRTKRLAWMLCPLLGVGGGIAQQQATTPAPIERRAQTDAAADAASALIGRPLVLRCFCAENSLSFDSAGRLAGIPKTTDWTLAAVSVLKVERRGLGAVELNGVRVAVRYNVYTHEYERKPQSEEKVKIGVADTGDAKQFARALDAVFAVGIDVRLQRAMPTYWQHMFDPRLPWTDALEGQPIYVPGPQGGMLGPNGGVLVAAPGAKAQPAVSAPVVTHKGPLSYTPLAARDHVKGVVQLRFVVDAQGMPQRVSIVQPLGYGLDARAVQSVEKFRFTPAMRDGKPVAASVLMNQEFTLVEQQVVE